jgi:hypothetical protein
VKIVSHATNPIGLEHVGLQLPYTEEQFAWLEDPLRATAQSFYRLPFSRDSFSREEVINHRLHKKLLPGVPIEGFLLGVIHQALPERAAGEIVGRLRILDRSGKESCQRVSLYIDSRIFRAKSVTSSAKCYSSAPAGAGNPRQSRSRCSIVP